MTVKVLPGRTVQEIKFPGAPYGVKMACGENPKRVYNSRGPSTRMGNMAGYRAAFIEAERYRRKWDTWLKDRKGDAPDRNLRNETLAGVLRGEILVQNHCYRADEMAQMLDLAREFGFKIRAFHHAVESYKSRRPARRGRHVGRRSGRTGGASRIEAMDGILENAALQSAGRRASGHSLRQPQRHPAPQSGGGQGDVRRRSRGHPHHARSGIALDYREPGLDARHRLAGRARSRPARWRTSSSGRRDPFSVYAQALQVYNDGWLVYDRTDPRRQPRTDFELRLVPLPGADR